MNHTRSFSSETGVLANVDYLFETNKKQASAAVRSRAPRALYRDYGKRALDLAVTIAILPILIPQLLLMIFLVWWEGGAPVYTQKRVGRNGRVFTMFKIRTMVRDADEQLKAYLAQNPEAKREWDLHQKLHNDPRITRIGRFLRKTSFDEFPQFLNVLTGDMSLIGPRPFMEDQRDLYPGTAYYAMRPGLSGPWQVSKRSESSFVERRDYDDHYLQTLSLKTDLGIVASTFRVILKGSGV